MENPAALTYLTDQRAFTIETIKKYKLGFKDGAIATPYFKDGIPLNIKYRPIKESKQKYFREEGYPSILFNLDNAQKYQGSIIVTEGEFDSIAFDQMGFQNVVSVPNGSETFADEWIDDLEKFNEIYISYDMDEPGRKGAEKIANRIGRYRCINVILPLKDANDCLKAGFTNQEMAEFLAKAKPFESKLIKGPEAFFDGIRDLYNGRLPNNGIPTGWNALDGLDRRDGKRENDMGR